MRRTAIACLLLASLLAGCATPIPLNTLRYEQKARVSSAKEASVIVVSGEARGGVSSMLVPAGAILVPVTIRSTPSLQFHSSDQLAFGESLRSELVRLGILKTAAADMASVRDLTIRVTFRQTDHDPGSHVYKLDVVAEMTGGKEPLQRQYKVVSSERDSVLERMNTNTYEGKAKAARLLLEKIIPDIERYVESM